MHCYVVSVTRIVRKRLRLKSHDFRYKVPLYPLYISYVHIKFDDEIKSESLKTLPRRRRCRHFGVVWKLTFSNSHIRMLLYIRHPSGPCSDIGHLGHYKITELNWTELSEFQA